MKHELSSARCGGKLLPQWQIEVLGGGRIWYLVDEERKICWLKLVGRGHPKQTE
ncbi:hypothetical protein [Streptomyces decoyicus]|uniref:hypothetical protein n=1 Tax=Streptomyces decoyicus TaxID=249567 RepID=UPI002E1938E5|nr:hypothetical protein OG532_39960 [Streptomyces decoyicus]